MAKIHFANPNAGAFGPLVNVLCGWIGSRYTYQASEVTCVTCLKILADVPHVAIPTPVPARVGCREPAVNFENIERAAWLSWRHALAFWVSYVDEGYPVRSASDPRRFEAQVFDRHAGGGEDTGQRIAAQLAPISKAFESALDAADTLDKVLVTSVFTGSVCGMPQIYIAPGRKHASVVRSHWPESEIASHHEISVQALRGIVRAMGQRFEGILISKGLVANATDWSKEDMRKEMLRGWKSIAHHLGWTVETTMRAQNWYPPIPILRVGGLIEADPEAIDMWRASSPKLKPPSNEAT